MSDAPMIKLAEESGAEARFGTDPTGDADRPVGAPPRHVPPMTEGTDDEIDRERADDDGMAPLEVSHRPAARE